MRNWCEILKFFSAKFSFFICENNLPLIIIYKTARTSKTSKMGRCECCPFGNVMNFFNQSRQIFIIWERAKSLLNKSSQRIFDKRALRKIDKAKTKKADDFSDFLLQYSFFYNTNVRIYGLSIVLIFQKKNNTNLPNFELFI